MKILCRIKKSKIKLRKYTSHWLTIKHGKRNCNATSCGSSFMLGWLCQGYQLSGSCLAILRAAPGCRERLATTWQAAEARLFLQINLLEARAEINSGTSSLDSHQGRSMETKPKSLICTSVTGLGKNIQKIYKKRTPSPIPTTETWSQLLKLPKYNTDIWSMYVSSLTLQWHESWAIDNFNLLVVWGKLMTLAVLHDQRGPIETTYPLPVAVCSLGPLGSAAPLPTGTPCLSHWPKEGLEPFHCLYVVRRADHIRWDCAWCIGKAPLIERTFSKMGIQRCVHTSLGEPDPIPGWHEVFLGLVFAFRCWIY